MSLIYVIDYVSTGPYPPGGDVISNAVGDTAVNFQWNQPWLTSSYEFDGFEVGHNWNCDEGICL